MNPKIDTAALLARLDIVQVIERWVPLTKSGAEYEACCPFHTEKTPSFKVNPAKQIFNCFGCGAGHNAIDFVMKYQSLSFVDACAYLSGEGGAGDAAAPVPRPAVERAKRSPWVPVLPAPNHAGAPPIAHSVRGKPSATWTYRDAGGRTLGFVYRFQTSDGGKETLPLVWARNGSSGREEWRWMAFPEPRPLYGLDRLADRPADPVLVVEGEKCADAGHAMLPLSFATVSWPGGGKAVDKADWSPLAGRKVVLWADCDAKRVMLTKAERDALPDDDARLAVQAARPLLPECEQPGVRAMDRVESILRGLGCTVSRVLIPAPGEKPDGWDIADMVAEGATEAAVMAMIDDATSSAAEPCHAAAQGEGEALPAMPQGGSTPPGAAASGGGGDDHGDWRARLLMGKTGPADCRENIYMMLRHHPAWRGVLWADEFARKVVRRAPAPWESPRDFKRGVEWGEDDDLRLGMWLAQHESMLIRSTENLSLSVGWAARESRCHPVREYLDALTWDGTERLEHWLIDYLGLADKAYTRLSGALFLIAMVARIYRPGCTMRAMPILEGAQFRGKSTALRILGGDWFGDTPIDLNNKDAYQLIQGRWLYEIAELDAFNRSETTRIKAFISSPEDRFRPPYDRVTKEWPRHTVFAGSTNQDEYFKDPSGNTRYWPWRVEAAAPIRLDALAEARDQLFAEAVVRFRRGERWHPTRDEQQRLFEPEQADREIADPWESIIARHIRGMPEDRITVTEILVDALKVEASKLDSARQMSTRVGIAMKRLGWIKKREAGGDREYYYQRPAIAGASNDGGDRAPF